MRAGAEPRLPHECQVAVPGVANRSMRAGAEPRLPPRCSAPDRTRCMSLNEGQGGAPATTSIRSRIDSTIITAQ